MQDLLFSKISSDVRTSGLRSAIIQMLVEELRSCELYEKGYALQVSQVSSGDIGRGLDHSFLYIKILSDYLRTPCRLTIRLLPSLTDTN